MKSVRLESQSRTVLNKSCLSAALAVTLFPSITLANENVLEEIVVTATKAGSATKLIETPIAMTVQTGERLEELGAEGMEDFLANAGGVSLAPFDPTSAIIQIRGVSSQIGDASVGYYLDDLPFSILGRSAVPEVNPFDLERVEILKGPQGTIYGASSAGGVVRILTKDAHTEGFEAKLDTTISYTDGGSENYRLNGALNIPIVEGKFGARLVAGTRSSSGYIDNSITGDDEVNESDVDTARLKLLWTPSEDLTIRASYWYYDFQVDSSSFANDDFERPSPINPEPKELDYDLYNLTFDWNIGEINVYSATSYIDSYYFGIDGLAMAPVETPVDTFMNETRIASTGDSAFQWSIGTYYKDTDQSNNIELLLAPGFSLDLTKSDQTSEQIAVFGEGRYRFNNEKMQASVGLRYFEDDRTNEENSNFVRFALTGAGIDPDRDADFNDLSPRFNLTYFFEDGGIVYGTVSKGFRSGNTQANNIFLAGVLGGNPDVQELIPGAIDEEIVWNYEVGIKKPLLDGDLIVDVSAYYLEIEDIQFLSFVTPLVIVVSNAGDAEVPGIDWGFTYVGIDDWTFSLVGNYNASEYSDDFTGVSIKAGDRIAYSPDLTWAISIDYDTTLESLGANFYSHLGVAYTSKRTEYNTVASNDSDDITVVDLRAGLAFEKWSVSLFVDNLFDEDGAATFQGAFVGAEGQRLRPLTVGLQFNIDYF